MSHNGKSDNSPIFESHAPNTRRCCLCGRRHIGHREDRPTGRNGKVQRWAFCANCWQEYQGNGRDAEAALVALRYRTFLEMVVRAEPGREELNFGPE